MDTTKHYRAYLYSSLAREYNDLQIQNMLGAFDRISAAGGPEAAFTMAMNAYGNEHAPKAVQTVKDIINSELESFNKSHVGVSVNHRAKLAKNIKALNEKIDMVGIIFNGQELTKEEIERIKPRIPLGCREPVMYSATAAHKGKPPVKFAISIAI